MNVEFELNSASYVLGAFLVIGLGLIYYTLSPPPAIHPFLLGRQVLSTPTRNTNESPVYASSTGGGMRAPQRPEKGIKSVGDILNQSQSRLEGARGSWSKGGEKVSELVAIIRAGLLASLGNSTGTVAVLLEDPTGKLVLCQM